MLFYILIYLQIKITTKNNETFTYKYFTNQYTLGRSGK